MPLEACPPLTVIATAPASEARGAEEAALACIAGPAHVTAESPQPGPQQRYHRVKTATTAIGILAGKQNYRDDIATYCSGSP